MKRITAFFLIILSAFLLNVKATESNRTFQIWLSGNVVLTDGTSIEGVIKYDLEADAVHIKVNNAIRTFVASQIIGFNFTEENIEGRRVFISLPFEVSQGYKRPKLFEVIYTNNISLLAREENPYSTWTTLDPSVELSGLNSRYNVSNYDFYLSDKKGSITMVEKGVKGTARSFDAHQKELKVFIRRNKLNIKQVGDMVRLVDYYNNLELKP